MVEDETVEAILDKAPTEKAEHEKYGDMPRRKVGTGEKSQAEGQRRVQKQKSKLSHNVKELRLLTLGNRTSVRKLPNSQLSSTGLEPDMRSVRLYPLRYSTPIISLSAPNNNVQRLLCLKKFLLQSMSDML
jgi:hypothetical protein